MERLVHWQGTPEGVCERKDSKADQRVTTQQNGTTITDTAEASHPENITCTFCREIERADWEATR